MTAYISPALDRLNAAQGKSLLQRVHMMEDMLATISTTDLRPAFPFILQEIFDFDKDSTTNQGGWQLDGVFRSHNYELFSRLLRVLGPEGPLMKLVNSLQTDSQAIYEFPLKALPAPSRHMIEEGAVPSFYANKLHGHSFSTAVLMLNAFELMMFHLAYALVCPAWHARNQGWTELYEFVYPALIDSYLLYFLPCDKNSLPSVPYSATAIRSSMGSISPMRSAYRPPSPPLCSPSPSSPQSPSRPSLFKASFVNAQKQHQQSVPVFDKAEAEIWRSETFLQVIAEFWLNQNSPGGSEVLSFGSLQENVMPTLNQVKMVRLLVKYVHHFANSAVSVITSPYQTHVQSPLDQFKRSVIPHVLQKKMYTFLRHAFERWPLDLHFRMVLETWLSYIQPWRYTDLTNRYNVEPQHSDTDISKFVDDKWDQFVEDNVLFYTVLMSEFVPRVFRLDLTSPHSAYMVYRVSRILSLPNLSTLIHKAEQELFGGVVRQVDLGGSYLSVPGGHLMGTIPSSIMDMEGPNFQYIPFFSDTMKHNMNGVVDQLAQALETVRYQQDKARLNSKGTKSQGFLSALFSFKDSSSTDSPGSPERKRLPGHLEYTIHNFCTIFLLPKPAILTEQAEDRTAPPSVGNESAYLTEMASDLPECVETEHGLRLTDHGRRQLMMRERHFDKFDVGDPDLLPVRSYENTTLVRLLFHFCAFINSYLRVEFSNTYYRADFVGQLARVFLTPPSTPKHKVPGSRSTYLAYGTQSHQPRISLRFLASYRSLLHIGIVYLVQSFFLGFGPIGFVFLTLTVVLCYGVIVASIRTGQAQIGAS